MHIIKILLLLSVLSLQLLSAEKPYVQKDVLEKIAKKYNTFATRRFTILQMTLDETKKASDLDKLNAVNEFYNEVRYARDIDLYNQSDYWATPFEFLGKDAGDCEDYVISKYFALEYLGILPEKLFFSYVKSTRFKGAHMVLTYFETPHAEPLVLDSINRRIFSASQRKDLIPIYNFSPAALKNANNGKTHKKWDQLIYNIEKGKI